MGTAQRHGDAQNPLQEAVLRNAIVHDPADRAKYACLIIGDKQEGTNSFAMHWVTAVKAGAGILFTDHQLDTQDPAAQWKLVGRIRMREQGLFGPQTGSANLRFAGDTPCAGTYRYMAIGVPGWTSAMPNSVRSDRIAIGTRRPNL